jgi:ABC-type transport system involved in multi-copper enzyme maturation permease subunit
MSATLAEPGLIDISNTRRTPFSRLVTVELRKSYDTRSGFWLLASMAIVTVLTLGIMLIVAATNDSAVFAYGDFVGGVAFLTGFLLPVLGILLVTSEWSQRTAMTSFALEPHRGRVVMAKLVTGLIWTLLIAGFAVAAGAVANALNGVITGEVNWDFGFNYFLGFLVTQAAAMLGGFALAALLLNSPAAIVAFFAYKWIIPILFGIAGAFIGWVEKLLPWIDFQTAQEPVFDWTVNTGNEWAHLLVSGSVWLVLPLALGLWRVLRAEVK